MSIIESLSATHDLLRNYLIQESYSHGCNCRNCDALTKVNEAQEQIKTLITHLVSRENPSAESKAQECSKAVADRESPLAIATEVSLCRFDLWLNGKRIATCWEKEVWEFCRSQGLGVIDIKNL